MGSTILPDDVGTRRVRLIEICPEMILEFLKPPNFLADGMKISIESDAIPDSAEALRCGINERGNVCLVIQDLSFSEILPGEGIPRLNPRYRVDYETVT